MHQLTHKPVPHYHSGQVEACMDGFCVRVTTEERNAAVLGGGIAGAALGALLTRSVEGTVAGGILGALLGVASVALGEGRPT